MSLSIKRGVCRDATRELTQAFRLADFCRELTKVKIIPGSEHVIGRKLSAVGDVVREPMGEYGTTKKPAGE